MSDEEREVDVDVSDDESEEGGAGSSQNQQAEKRAHHNALERKRRDHIKDSFHSLRDAVPELQGEKTVNDRQVSRAQILKKAAEYISTMREKNVRNQQDIDKMKQSNEEIIAKIEYLEKYPQSDDPLMADLLDGSFKASDDDEATTPPRRKKQKVRT